METYTFKCRIAELEHNCATNPLVKVRHPEILDGIVRKIANPKEELVCNGIIKSPKNSFQINYDLDDCINKYLINWGFVPLSNSVIHDLKDIPNITPDGIFKSDESTFCIEVEKSNKKTIWFDYIKFMMLIGRGISDYGILIVPRNYAHKHGVWNLFNEARYYRECLATYAQIAPEILNKVAIIGYTHQCFYENQWTTLTSQIAMNIKKQASSFFGDNTLKM